MPEQQAAITKITKEGGWYRFDGVVDGKRLGIKMSAPDMETRSYADVERYILGMLIDASRTGPDGTTGE
jgi:hypothetical protein